MRTVGEWDVLVYFLAVLVAIGIVFAITAFPGHPAELFPNASADELVQGARWLWKGAAAAFE